MMKWFIGMAKSNYFALNAHQNESTSKVCTMLLLQQRELHEKSLQAQ